MVDPAEGTSVGGRGATETVLEEGVPAVNTDYALSGTRTGIDASVHQPALQSQKRRFSWSNIQWEDKGQAIIDGSNLDGSASYPTIIHGPSVFDNPLDEWYLYWSSHDFNDTALHTAPSLWSSPSGWTFQGSVLSDSEGSQTASPWAVYDPEFDRLNLFYHTDPGTQHTKLAYADSTGDGTSFTIEGVVIDAPSGDRSVWDGLERSYLRGVRLGSDYVGVYQGRDGENAPGIGVAYSRDGGLTWTTEPTPAFDNTQWSNYDPQSFQGGSPDLAAVGGELAIIYEDRSAEELRALPFADRDKPLAGEGETVYPRPSWSSGVGLNMGELLIEDGHLYLFYGTGPNEGLDVGVARADLRGDLV